MKTLLISFYLILVVTEVSSQEVKMLAGHTYTEYFPISERFRYPQFQNGRFYLKNGKLSAVAKFNYDVVLGKVVVIQKGDTLPIQNQDIDHYKIGNDTFLSTDSDVIEIISDSGKIKLGINRRYVVERAEKKVSNGYTDIGQTSSATSTGNSLGNMRGFIPADVVIEKLTTYYISVGGTVKTFKATKSKTLKFFSTKKKEIQEYIQDKKTDFDSQSDLEQLVVFLNSIMEKKENG